ncbi:helicase-related protein [uncultured Oscillibacter sp.]|uniref:helicase-related protein n=1 Tax=uncultured Oscillibacter sp. TaxID=876091 RepID=UPI0025DC8685|nr:helicase-related protein [uncultured Oscillibacter sp.]
MIPKDFQEATAKRIFEIFRDEGQNHILLADEVGLGKTIIASDVIRKVSEWHRIEKNDNFFKVIYICSNINIASQNCRKLGIAAEDCLHVSESRLSMQHLRIYQTDGSDHNYEQLIPMTPATSFSMTGGQGIQEERALIFVFLRRFRDFSHVRKHLNQLLQMDPKLRRWDEIVNNYEMQVSECNRVNRAYISDMLDALEAAFKENEALYEEILELCRARDVFAIPYRERSDVINRLRRIFAQISLDKLDPDLVIMDEFQRFKDLITPQDTESGMLSQKFLHDPSVKVLLLSATPYKPYTTLEELAIGEEGHYKEFTDVMDFLLYDSARRARFHQVWSDYSHHLSELKTDDFTALIVSKNDAECAMYSCVCRTERFTDSLTDRSKACEMGHVDDGDILSYLELQALMDRLGLGRFPIDYVKSAPYLMSFMNYKVKDQICERLEEENGDNKDVLSSQTMLLRRNLINRYEKIPCNNARLQLLFDEAFGQGRNGAELMLWIPASRPYYKTDNVFSRNAGYSKTLVFSSWEMVPRMIAGLTSYEAERLTIGRINNRDEAGKKRYFAEESKRRTVSRRLRDETEEVVTYPSRYLAGLYKPLSYIDQGTRTIHTALEKQIESRIDDLSKHVSFFYKENGGAGQLLELLKLLDGEPDTGKLEVVSRSAASLLADMAIGSPGVCALRIFNDMDMAAAAAGNFISLFSRPEATAAMDVLYPTGDYYENVIKYCAAGNLQAVLDEYVFTLNLSGKELADAMSAAFITTATTQVETRESFLYTQKKSGLRTHFAVGYYDARISEKSVQRTENIRAAFNSPFRPFVLATTSIGQEGLDFHTYCRKIMHWNLPANPIDLEQREGRINRYLCHAIRQNLAENEYGNAPFSSPIWPEILQRAVTKLKPGHSDLIPFWCLPDDFPFTRKIERIIPMYPYSQDHEKYNRLLEVLSLYRLTLGQPRQEELLEAIKKSNWDLAQLKKLYINLSPYTRSSKL